MKQDDAAGRLKEIAEAFARERCSDAIYPSHLFKAVLHKDMGLVGFIESGMGKDYYYLQEWADMQMTLSPKAVRPPRDLELSDEAAAVFEEAEQYRLKMGRDSLDAVCLLASLATPGVGFSFDELKTLTLTAAEVMTAAGTPAAKAAAETGGTQRAAAPEGGSLSKYCINKTALARDGKIDPVVGFEKEISSIFEALGRKSKTGLLITGEAGVGKTSLLNAFALRLASGEVPSFLKGSEIYEADMAAISADSAYKGEAEDRFKKLIAELGAAGGSVLIIESVDKLFDKQGSLYGLSELLKREMAKGGLALLCTSSIDGYTKHIETDKEFAAAVEKINIEEPDKDSCLRILKGIAPAYEGFHGIKAAEDVLSEAISLAKRYLTEKRLPDSAIDLIDRTMSQLKTANDMTAEDAASYRAELENIKNMSGGDDAKMAEAAWLNYRINSKTSCIITASLEQDGDFAKTETIEGRLRLLENSISAIEKAGAEKRFSLTAADLCAVVARQTGIPMGKVQVKERDRLLGAEDILKQRVVGQDHAVKKVLDAVFESRSGLNKKGQPMGSFFFLGPTGTGKTELSKALAEFLFGDESSLIRFDMSEFKEEHSVALLYGAPPGYVGYEEGGLLVNKIRQHPYSVVLFDEIEKAHKSVFDLFLQILDEGKLHDRLGRAGDFSNALILFTSNIGSQYIVEQFGKGIIPANNDLMDIMQGYFRPEFLGRLTEIVPFAPISEQTVARIFDIHLKGLLRLLEEQNIKLEISDDTKRQIAMMGFSPQYGARPIIGIIRKELRNPLSKLIIAGKIKPGDTVLANIKNKEVSFELKK